MKKFIHLFSLMAVLLTACDCMQEVTGEVRDKETNAPLADVAIQAKFSLSYNGLTDSTGLFGYRGISGGLFGCPNVRLTFSKEGYKTAQRSFNSFMHGETVLLSPKVAR
jgi:hypothetical protein